MVYAIDTLRIERQLAYLRTCTEVLHDVRSLRRTEEQFAAARALHMAIECVTDVGNALIDGFIMRDPGSYEDIVEIMKDEAVLPAEEADPLKRLVQFRRALVVGYIDVGKADLEEMMGFAQALKPFPERVEAFLKRELGPNAPSSDA